jgi:hypothetical protein
MNEWTEFYGERVVVDGEAHAARDVPGDGSCFFHSVLARGLIPVDNAGELRRLVVRYMKHEGTEILSCVHTLLADTDLFGRPVPFMEYVDRLGRPGTYAGTIAATAIALMFTVR